MVTQEMHNNLKNTINKMDDEITQFAKRYEEEQANEKLLLNYYRY